MNKIDRFKIIRCLIAGFAFLCLTSYIGYDERTSQQIFFTLFSMMIISLLIDNIWIVSFVWWSVLVFCFYKFKIGMLYMSNIFLGCMLYYTVKEVFKKEHIVFFINAVLWLCFINIAYMTLQICGWDIFYNLKSPNTPSGMIQNFDPCGFMSLKACMGILMAICVPLLAGRGTLTSKIASFGLYLPLYLSRASSCMAAAIIGHIFVLWWQIRPFKVKFITIKRWCSFSFILVLLIIGCGLFIWKVDAPMGTLPDRINLWRIVLRDSTLHPLQGWGLDVFRNTSEWKPQLYCMDGGIYDGKRHIDIWDNVHNLWVQLAFEFSFFSWFLFGGYLRQSIKWFKEAPKEPLTVALTGFFITFLIVNVGQFPMFLARSACYMIPLLAMWEITIRGGKNERGFGEKDTGGY